MDYIYKTEEYSKLIETQKTRVKNDIIDQYIAIRKEKGLSQENLAYALGKNKATICRFENGQLLPDAEEIYLICNELEIDEYELFNSRDALLSKKESKNPFGVDKLYVYYYGYYPTLNKFDKCKFVPVNCVR